MRPVPIGNYSEIPYVERQAPPSSYAIAALLDGERGAVKRVAWVTAKRVILIAPGLWLAGRRGRNLWKESAFASVSITLALVGVYASRKRQLKRPMAGSRDSGVINGS